MEEFKIKYKTNLIIMQEKINLINLIKQNNNKKFLFFDAIDNQKPLIDISSMLLIDENNEADRKKRAWYGTLLGEFSSFVEKEKFWTTICKIACEKITTFPIKISLLTYFFKFFTELYILIDVIRVKKLLDVKTVKIYKFEAPDFVIETETGKIVGLEITFCEDFPTSSWSYINIYNVCNNQDYNGKIGIYKEINDNNIANIKKHFKNKEKYLKNLKNKFNHDNGDIFYFIPLGGINRISREEYRALKEIAQIATNNCISLDNIFLEICHENFGTSSSWNTLAEIINDLESINKANTAYFYY